MLHKLATLSLASSMLIFSLSSCGGKRTEEALPEFIKPIKYAQVVRAGQVNRQTYAGTVQSSKEAQLSFKVNGNINYLPVKIGDRVRKGQLIARIDATDYRVQVEQSKSNLLGAETQIKSAESQLLSTRANYQRVEKLYENNSVSLSDFEQAKSALETSEAAYEAAKAQAAASEQQVQSTQNQVKYSQLVAPFSGIITAINVEENEFVGAGTPIAILNSETDLEVLVGVPEVSIASVKRGQQVGIEFSALNSEPFTGRITEVGFSSAGRSTYPVTIRIEKPSETIRPGMAARVQFGFQEAGEAGAEQLFVPIAAVGQDQSGRFVYTLQPTGDVYQVERRSVQVGELGADGFEVKDGLKESELVATSGLKTLIVGMKVRLLEN